MPIDMSNRSFAQDNKVGVSDQGIGAGVFGAASGGNGIALGFGAQLGNTTNFGTITDGGAVKAAFDYGAQVSADISQVFSGALASNAATVNANTNALGSALSAITDLGKTTATGGQSDTNKTFLYLGLGAVALVFLLLRR